MTEEKNMNFFNRVITSIKDFEKYAIFATEKTKKAICYLALIMFIFSLVISSTFTYKFFGYISKGITYFKDNINQITFENDNISINSR